MSKYRVVLKLHAGTGYGSEVEEFEVKFDEILNAATLFTTLKFELDNVAQSHSESVAQSAKVVHINFNDLSDDDLYNLADSIYHRYNGKWHELGFEDPPTLPKS